MTSKFLIGLSAVLTVAAGAYVYKTKQANTPVAEALPTATSSDVAPPVVTAARVTTQDFIETALVTGSIVAREEIVVAPEVDGLRVLEVRADVGDRVKKGDILAVLVFEQLDAQLAQNEAALARTTAAIAQARSQIAEAEAREAEAKAQLDRARPLVRDKFLSESTFDTRQAAAKTSAAQRLAAESGLRSAEAEKAQVEAQRRELLWRRGNTEIRAPEEGVISARNARIGAIAMGGAMAPVDPMFRIIAKGEVELDAEASELQLARIHAGQKVKVEIAGAATLEGTVRLVSREVSVSTRLGRVRIFLGARDEARVGAFARGMVETARSRNLAIPQSAVLFSEAGPTVQAIVNDKVETRPIEVGLAAAGLLEVTKGLAEGDVVVAKAGTFLRNGDAVKAELPDAKVSEAAP